MSPLYSSLGPVKTDGSNLKFGDSDYIIGSPIDEDLVRRSCATGGVWEAGTKKFAFVVRDPDNPECVIEIINTSVFGTETEDTVPVVDERGYVGYMVDGYFVRNK